MNDALRVPRRPYYLADTAALAAAADPADDGLTLREIADDNVDELGAVLVAGIRGTVDDEGESAEDCADGLRAGLEGAWGEPIRSCWLALIDADGRIASAIATTRWWGTPFIAIVMTRPDAQRRGSGTRLIREVATRCAAAGEARLGLIVTRGNPALHLYEHLGFAEQDRPADGMPD